MGGIIQYHCETRINHAVQIVGYDISGTTIITFVLSYYVSLRSEFRVVMSVTKFHIKSMFGSFYKQLLCLIYVICVCLPIVVYNTYCVMSWFCVPYVASFSGLSVFGCPVSVL